MVRTPGACSKNRAEGAISPAGMPRSLRRGWWLAEGLRVKVNMDPKNRIERKVLRRAISPAGQHWSRRRGCGTMQASSPAQGRAWLWVQTTRQRAMRQAPGGGRFRPPGSIGAAAGVAGRCRHRPRHRGTLGFGSRQHANRQCGKRLPNRGGKGPGKRRTPPSALYGASTSPARGGFQGGGRSQSLPCKGRWQRVSDDGRVHCRPAPEVSCRVTPTQGVRRPAGLMSAPPACGAFFPALPSGPCPSSSSR